MDDFTSYGGPAAGNIWAESLSEEITGIIRELGARPPDYVEDVNALAE